MWTVSNIVYCEVNLDFNTNLFMRHISQSKCLQKTTTVTINKASFICIAPVRHKTNSQCFKKQEHKCLSLLYHVSILCEHMLMLFSFLPWSLCLFKNNFFITCLCYFMPPTTVWHFFWIKPHWCIALDKSCCQINKCTC